MCQLDDLDQTELNYYKNKLLRVSKDLADPDFPVPS